MGRRFRWAAPDDDMPWDELARTFKERVRGKPPEERSRLSIEAFQAIRDAGEIDTDKAFVSIAHEIDCVVHDRIDAGTSPALKRLSGQIRRVKKAHGLADGEHWLIGCGPPEYQELSKEYDRVVDEIMVATFEEFGEPEMGALYQHEPEEFQRRYERGRLKMFPEAGHKDS